VRVLGVDLGLRRIGFAISDASGTLARPLEVHTLSDSSDALRVISMVAARVRQEEGGLGAIVVGLPRRLDGSASDLTAAAHALAAALGREVGVPVILQDERLTSREAEERLARTEKDWRRRKERVDAVAAAIVLQDYLDGGNRD
jgi:putative Holliday junction resolvase